jgi:hypothetical protein
MTWTDEDMNVAQWMLAQYQKKKTVRGKPSLRGRSVFKQRKNTMGNRSTRSRKRPTARM